MRLQYTFTQGSARIATCLASLETAHPFFSGCFLKNEEHLLVLLSLRKLQSFQPLLRMNTVYGRYSSNEEKSDNTSNITSTPAPFKKTPLLIQEHTHA